MKLYHSARTRSGRPLWLLEELGVPYDLVTLDMSKGEHKSAEYLQIHPHGAVPALVDGDVKMFESAAICMYLADKFSEKGLAPKIDSPERAAYYQWIVYTMATIEPPILKIFMNTVMLPEEQRSAKVADEGRGEFKKIASVLSAALEGKEYLVANRFSTADVMVGSTLAWASFMGLIADYPALQAYVRHLTERPAFQRAQTK